MPDRIAAVRLLGLGPTATPSLRGRILTLVLALVLSMGGLASLALWQAYAAARDQVSLQIVSTTRALARVVDQEFARTEALLQGLALMPSLQHGDFASFIETARFATETLGLPILAVAGPDGLQHASTAASAERLAQGLPATSEAMRAFTSGRTEISDLQGGNTSGQPRVVVAVPVRQGRDGPVLCVLGLVLPREQLTAALRKQQLPDDWIATVLDRSLTIVARTRAEETAIGQPVPGPIRQAIGDRAEGLLPDSANLEGESIVIAFAQSPFSGYRVAIGVPHATFEAGRRDALLRLAVLVVPVAALGVALALLLARSLALSLRSLTRPNAATPELQETAELSTALAAERAARDQAEAELRDRSAWLEAAQRAGEVGVWAWDVHGDSARWSDGLAGLLGLPGGSAAAAAYRQFRALVLPSDRAALDATIAGILADRPAEIAAEFRIRRPDGALRWLRAQGSLLPAQPGAPPLMLGAFIDITARRALEADREVLLRQQEFLAGEIHHRVKNSLQIVLSLLLMQARRASPEASVQLREAAGRVATVASVHRRLYEDQPESGGDAGRYMAGLVEDLRSSLADCASGRDLRLVAEAGLRPGVERLAPLGIVATELMTNALKYGTGTVTVRLRQVDGELELAVEDEGPGFPPDFDLGASRGLGMRVAMTLTRQADGRLEVDRAAAGGRVVLRIPAAAPAPGA